MSRVLPFPASRRRYFILWLLTIAAYLMLSAVLLIQRSAWVDEIHFVETVRLFGSAPWPGILADYPEVTPPLFYAAYALWGSVFGFELVTLRLFSLLLAFGTLLALYRFVSRRLHTEFSPSGGLHAGTAFLLCTLLLLNPYLPGASAFVFTDMSALLFVLLAFHFFSGARFAAAALSLSAALLCRQYAVVFWATLVAPAAWGAVFSVRRALWRRAFAWLVAAPLPLAVLGVVWGGLAPPSGRSRWVIAESSAWNPHAFTAYAAFLAIYLVPVLLVWGRRFRGRGGLFLAAVPAGLAYLAFPVRASAVAREQAGIETVGLAHRALRALAGSGALEHAILGVVFCLGVWLLLAFVRDDMRLWKRGEPSPVAALSLAVYFFLLIMPFSYQIWEKYLLLILPFAALRFVLLPQLSGQNTRQQHASKEIP